MYLIQDNVLSIDLVDSLHEKYAKILDTDLSSYEIWPKETTQYGALPESFAANIEGSERINIITELYNNPSSPFYKNKMIRNGRIAIQKLVDGGSIPVHSDVCIGSLTLFLNKDEIQGGEFYWTDKDGNKHCVTPAYNRGVYTLADTVVTTASHGVNPVIGSNRYTLQMFV
jgi:hypothetical protein